MFKGIWQWVKDELIDPVTNFLKLQEDIDKEIKKELERWGTVSTASTEVPSNSKRRKNVFISHHDVIHYIKQGGIPANYVFILILPDWDEEGNDGYAVFVTGD